MFVKNHSVDVATSVLFNVIDSIFMYDVRLTTSIERKDDAGSKVSFSIMTAFSIAMFSFIAVFDLS